MKITIRNRKFILIGVVAILMMSLVCYLAYEPMLAFIEDSDTLKENLKSLGVFGGLILTLVMALQIVFVFLPGEIVEVMAGFVYGPVIGALICLLGVAIGTTIIYWFVKKFGIKVIDRCLGKEKINEVSFLKNNDNLDLLLFIIFFIPGTPKDIITYFIPLTGMKLSKFLAITSVARIPSVVSSTIGGNALGMAQYEFTIFIFAITGLFSMIGLYFYKIKINKCSNENL